MCPRVLSPDTPKSPFSGLSAHKRAGKRNNHRKRVSRRHSSWFNQPTHKSACNWFNQSLTDSIQIWNKQKNKSAPYPLPRPSCSSDSRLLYHPEDEQQVKRRNEKEHKEFMEKKKSWDHLYAPIVLPPNFRYPIRAWFDFTDINRKLTVVCIEGPHHSGKNFILRRLMEGDCASNCFLDRFKFFYRYAEACLHIPQSHCYSRYGESKARLQKTSHNPILHHAFLGYIHTLEEQISKAFHEGQSTIFFTRSFLSILIYACSIETCYGNQKKPFTMLKFIRPIIERISKYVNFEYWILSTNSEEILRDIHRQSFYQTNHVQWRKALHGENHVFTRHINEAYRNWYKDFLEMLHDKHLGDVKVFPREITRDPESPLIKEIIDSYTCDSLFGH